MVDDKKGRAACRAVVFFCHQGERRGGAGAYSTTRHSIRLAGFLLPSPLQNICERQTRQDGPLIMNDRK